MTKTAHTTTTAAQTAKVTVATIRTWCRVGAVAATKTAGKWLIDAASLARRITIGAQREDARIAAIEAAANVIDLTAFQDAKNVRDKAVQLIIDRSIIATRHEGQYLAVASDGISTYLVDAIDHSCTCKGFGHWGRCNHLVAADIMTAA